jgi:uncharacterized LabA/DUF88 family protein
MEIFKKKRPDKEETTKDGIKIIRDAVREGFNEVKEEIDKIYRELSTLNAKGKRWEDLRVGIFVDVQNMFYAAKKQYASRLDFVKLTDHVLKGRRLIKAIAYVVKNPEIDQTAFFSMLGHHSFEVKSKELISRIDGSQKGDWDMGIALDILKFADSLDVVALVSGDGDFCELIDIIKTMGPRVEVYAFPSNTAMNLKEIADDFFPIGDELLWKSDMESKNNE